MVKVCPGGGQDRFHSGSGIVSGANALCKYRVVLHGMASRLTSHWMPVVQTLVNSCVSLCLVDMGSECTLVNVWVMVGHRPQSV